MHECQLVRNVVDGQQVARYSLALDDGVQVCARVLLAARYNAEEEDEVLHR